MNGILILILLLFFAPQLICGQNKFIPPVDWKPISECDIKFYIPSDFKEQKLFPVDSCIKSYLSDKTVIVIDVVDGNYRYTSLKHYYPDISENQYLKTEIDGRSAEIITVFDTDSNRYEKGLNYKAIGFVPKIGQDGGILTIWIYSSNDEERKKAMGIFNSFSFPKDK